MIVVNMWRRVYGQQTVTVSLERGIVCLFVGCSFNLLLVSVRNSGYELDASHSCPNCLQLD